MTDTILLKQKFRSSIRRGTGEAYLLAKEHPEIDFSSDIIKASLKNFAYDGQCEGSRAEYLWPIILLSRQQEKIRDAILKGLAAEKDDTWSLVQLFELAKLYSLEGDAQAKQAIYNRFYTDVITGSDWAGAMQIIEMDGIEGLKYIAETFGRGLEHNHDAWHDDSLIRSFNQHYPEIDVFRELDEAGADNHFIKKYTDEVKKNREERDINSPLKVVYKDIIEDILSRKPRRFLKIKLTEDELTLIAERFLIEKDTENREKLLAVFIRHKYPLDSSYILQLAKQYAKPRNKLGKIALDALAFLKSDDIRQFALEQIALSKKPELFTCIFRFNYQAGDCKLLTEIVQKAKNEFVVECLMHDYVRIFETNKTPECREPLEALYEKSNCGMHRSDIVWLLIENKMLSDKIKAEIKFDSDEDTRKLAEEID